MDNVTPVNEKVSVVTVHRIGVEFMQVCIPAKMKYRNHEIVFTELGLRHPTEKGKRMIHVFDMSDGVCDYRLEYDAESLTWTLIAILDLAHGRGGHD